MSIDISYLSFNTQRADEGWKEFWTLNLQEIVQAPKTQLALRYRLTALQLRRETEFSASSCFFQREGRRPTPSEKFNLETDIERGDVLWNPDVSQIDAEIEEVNAELNAVKPFPLALDRANFTYLFDTERRPFTRKDLRREILSLDVHFGTVAVGGFTSYEEMTFLYILLSLFVPWSSALHGFDSCSPWEIPRHEWIACFQEFDLEKVRLWIIQADDFLLSQLNIQREDIEEFLRDMVYFIDTIAPFIQDLETSGNIFLYEVNGEIDLVPSFLYERRNDRFGCLLKENPWILDWLSDDDDDDDDDERNTARKLPFSFDIHAPVAEKTFIAFQCVGLKPNEVWLELFSTPNPTPEIPAQYYADKIEVGETADAVITRVMNTVFHATHWQLFGVLNDGMFPDRKGNMIPRILVIVAMDPRETEGKQIHGLYPVWKARDRGSR